MGRHREHWMWAWLVLVVTLLVPASSCPEGELEYSAFVKQLAFSTPEKYQKDDPIPGNMIERYKLKLGTLTQSFDQLFQYLDGLDGTVSGCLSESDLGGMFRDNQEERAMQFMSGAFGTCIAPSSELWEPSPSCHKKKASMQVTTCLYTCKTNSILTGTPFTFTSRCLRTLSYFMFELPKDQFCGYRCVDPSVETNYMDLAVRSIDAKFRGREQELIASRFTIAYDWREGPTADFLQTPENDELALLHGGPRIVHDVQIIGGLKVTKTNDGRMTPEGCPAEVRLIGESEDMTSIKGPTIKIRDASNVERTFEVPECHVTCKHHRRVKDEWIRTIFDLRGPLLEDDFAPEFAALEHISRKITCKYNEAKKLFEYPIPHLPRCLVGACWGYPGARLVLPGQINEVEWKTGMSLPPPDRQWGGRNAPPRYQTWVTWKGVEYAYNPPYEAQGDDVQLTLKDGSSCPAEIVPPPPIPRLKPTQHRLSLPFPFPTQHQYANELSKRQATKKTIKIRKLLLPPWPGASEIWVQHRQIQAAAFPLVEDECAIYNTQSNLTQNGTVVFRRNPNPDLTKKPWQAGGLCLPSAQQEVVEIQADAVPQQAPKQAPIEEIEKVNRFTVPELQRSVPSGCQATSVGGTFFDGVRAFGISGGALQLHVGGGSEYLGSMTSETALSHLAGTSYPGSRWGDALDGGFLCSEERSTEPGIAVPGGDLGEWLVAMVVWSERESLSEKELADNLVLWLVKGGVSSFHWCIDFRMLQRICRETQWCPQDTRSFLNPPSEVIPDLLDLVGQPEVFGSHQIRALMDQVADKRVLRAAVRVLYALLWNADLPTVASEPILQLARSKLSVSVAPPNNFVGAIIEVNDSDCPSGVYPLLGQVSAYGSQAMTVYSTASDGFRLKLATFTGSMASSTPTQEELVAMHSRMNDLAQRTWKKALEMYSPGVPTFCVHYAPPKSTSCTFRPPFGGSPQQVGSYAYQANVVVAFDMGERTESIGINGLSAEELESDFKARTIQFASIFETQLGTLDGRQIDPLVACAGGDMGEWILALAAVQNTRGRDLTEQEIEEILIRYLKQEPRPTFTMYTDLDALSNLCHGGTFCPDAPRMMALDRAQRSQLILEQLLGLTGSQVDQVLQAATRLDSIGDPFLRFLLMRKSVSVSPQLISRATRAFFRVLLNRPSRLIFSESEHAEVADQLDLTVLQGDSHQEHAIVIMSNGPGVPSNQVPTLSSKGTTGSIVLYHEGASRLVRLRYLQAMVPQFLKVKSDFARVRVVTDVLAEQMVQEFFNTVYSALPIYRVQIR
eukprot:c14584_g1_i1.p1 GENE.c14584_g1_i1~~c14584_g1_i1.p1  ORF type:complete len:1298 (-),score=196.42 c14584_g1_i1:36-3929(-)